MLSPCQLLRFSCISLRWKPGQEVFTKVSSSHETLMKERKPDIIVYWVQELMTHMQDRKHFHNPNALWPSDDMKNRFSAD